MLSYPVPMRARPASACPRVFAAAAAALAGEPRCRRLHALTHEDDLDALRSWTTSLGERDAPLRRGPCGRVATPRAPLFK